ncbi:iron-sulfur cluster assembly accessory protein [Candidatus Micrarchaeota archaeon]|nr:iron-sulfur cluster assembly accessory protein [Candidatus Micrarchaeota archaeon]
MITGDSTIGEVVAKYPDVVEVMLKHGLHCIGCAVSPYETIMGGALSHGMSEDEVEKMVKELNAKIKSEEKINGKKGIGKSGDIEKDAVSLTKEAALKLKNFMKLEGKENSSLRITLTPGGCAGFMYGMDFTDLKTKEDLEIVTQGLKVLIDKQYLENIAGTTIDYKESLHGSGFVLKNPNVKSACGCGKSFS